ncbi:MAG: DUF6506 family protein [Pseudomonadota bacterium]
MALTRFGFVVTGAGLDPAIHRMTMASQAFTMTVIGVPHAAAGVAAAIDLRDSGHQLIELCGGFGPIWTGKIIEAVGPEIPVGSVSYGSESIDTIYALFAS